jgi:hypothetical protein
VLLRRDAQIQAVLQALKELGVHIAVDDFGTGFSSLRYLRDFPIDVVKIDKSFIDDITRDARQVALVEGNVRIADTLGPQVIAEGIEDPSQRDMPAAMGCRFGQGFLFARPMTVEQSERVLRQGGGRFTPGAGGTNGRQARRSAPSPAAEKRAADLEHLRRTSSMSDAVIDEVRGRRIRCRGHWLIDFASCNYLGFDWDPEIAARVDPEVRRWGIHPSWSRLLGSPRLYPVLADGGHVFVEASAHRTVYDGCVVARGQGATLHRFHAALLGARPHHPAGLHGRREQHDRQHPRPAGAGRALPRAGRDAVRRRRARLRTDRGARPGRALPLRPARQQRGAAHRGVVRRDGAGHAYDGIVLAGGFSKAYSSLLAFLALPTDLKNRLKTTAAPYLYSGPSPTASLATALAGLEVNDLRGTRCGPICTARPCGYSTISRTSRTSTWAPSTATGCPSWRSRWPTRPTSTRSPRSCGRRAST